MKSSENGDYIMNTTEKINNHLTNHMNRENIMNKTESQISVLENKIAVFEIVFKKIENEIKRFKK